MIWSLINNPAFLTAVAAAVLSFVLKAAIGAGWAAVVDKLENIATKQFVLGAIDNHRREVVQDIANLLASDERQARSLSEIDQKHKENREGLMKLVRQHEELEHGQREIIVRMDKLEKAIRAR